MSQHNPEKVVLVTASSAGLGAEIARTFAPDHRVIINYSSNRERGQKLLDELTEKYASSGDKPRFYLIGADAGRQYDIKTLVGESVKTFGRLDVVVSNVGWTRMNNFMNLDDAMVEEDWDRCFQYNVKCHLFLMHAVKSHLESTEGAFLVTSSTAGIKASGSSLAYSVTKAASIHLMKGLATICSPKVRVNSVSPGMLMTDWGMRFPEAKREAAKNNTKLKRLASLQDIALQFRTLAISQSCTGQNICVDSGATIQ